MPQQVLHSYLAVVLQAFFRYGVSAVAEYAFRSEHLVVEPEPSLFLQFHYADCRYEFGHRCHPHNIARSHCQGRIGILRSWTAVAYPVTLAENQGIIADHGQLSPVQMPVTHIFLHPGIHFLNSRKIRHFIVQLEVEGECPVRCVILICPVLPLSQNDNGQNYQQYAGAEYEEFLSVKPHIFPFFLQSPESFQLYLPLQAGKCPRRGHRWRPYPSLRT